MKLFATVAGLVALTVGPAMAQSGYPDHPVTVIVPWDAGGGTDTIIRILATGLEDELGQPVNVVNRTGGNGVVGHTAIARARPDGYTIRACTSEISYFETLGLAPITPDNFTLLARIADIPAGLTVRADGELETGPDVVEAAQNGSVTASGSGLGGPWHMAIGGMMQSAGADPNTVTFVPSQGGAPALQDLNSGGITIFSGSPVEAQVLADSGAVKIIAVMADERVEQFQDVPTLKEQGIDWSLSNWFSVCGPEGLPQDVTATLVEASEAASNSDQVREALAQRGITPVFEGPETFTEFAGTYAEQARSILTDLGLAQN